MTGISDKRAGAKRRRRLPRRLLLSDPQRLPDPRAAAARLPRGAGVLARALEPALRPELARLCRRRSLALLLAGEGRGAVALRAGLHLADRRPGTGLLPFLAARRAGAPWAVLICAAHGRAGIARGRRLRADALLLSPVFPTASHPGAAALGPLRFAALARRAGRAVLALGGMDEARWRRLPRRGAGAALGFAAIAGLSQPPPS